MKAWMAILVCGMLVGCDYSTPLVEVSDSPVDRSVLGLWPRTEEGGGTQSLLVLPLGEKEYLVSFPAGASNSMFARGRACRVGDLALVQVEWVGTAKGTLPDDDRVFQFLRYSLKGNDLTVNLLNSQVVDKTVDSPEALAAAITAKRLRADLFREDMVFHKVAAEQP